MRRVEGHFREQAKKIIGHLNIFTTYLFVGGQKFNIYGLDERKYRN